MGTRQIAKEEEQQQHNCIREENGTGTILATLNVNGEVLVPRVLPTVAMLADEIRNRTFGKQTKRNHTAVTRNKRKEEK